MAAINFPAASESPWYNPSNGITYEYVGGTWRSVNALSNSFDDEYVEVTGDNMTGNLTLGTDKIALNAVSGTAEFKGTISTNTSGAAFSLNRQTINGPADTLGVFAAAGVTKHRFVADGSAEFDGTLTLENRTAVSGSSIEFKPQSDNGASGAYASINAEGTNTTYGTDLVFSLRGNPSGVDSDIFEAVRFKYDGSATFAGGDVVIGKHSNNTKYVYVYAPDATSNRAAFGVFDRTGSTDLARINNDGSARFADGDITLNADGSAEFKGTSKWFNFDTSNNANAYGAQISTSASGDNQRTVLQLQSKGTAVNGAALGIRKGTSENVLIEYDGSAEFKGAITSGIDNTDATAGLVGTVNQIGINGAVRFSRLAGGSANEVAVNTEFNRRTTAQGLNGDTLAFAVSLGNDRDTLTSYIKADGSAYFKGDVTSDGTIGFNLEPNNPANYTTTTDAEGNETSVYNGPTLDVKERLTKADTALQTLKTAAAAAVDFAELKAAIATALADI